MTNPLLTRNYLFFLGTTILCAVVMYPFFFPVFAGVTIAYLCEPLSMKIQSITQSTGKTRRWAVPMFVICLVLFVIISPMLTILTNGIQELIAVISSLQENFKKEDMVSSVQKLRDVLKHLGLQYSVNDLFEKGSDVVKTYSKFALTETAKTLTATPQFILKVFLFLLTWFFFLVNGKEYRSRFLTKIIPWDREREVISKTVSGVLKALIVANVLVSLVQGILIAMVLGAFEVPKYILLGMLGFFCSFIPIIGTAPLMLGGAAWCYFHQNRPFAALGILSAAFGIAFIDNILRPLLMKGGVEISFFWIFLSIISGMATFGIAGAVLGPVIFALFTGTLKALER